MKKRTLRKPRKNYNCYDRPNGDDLLISPEATYVSPFLFEEHKTILLDLLDQGIDPKEEIVNRFHFCGKIFPLTNKLAQQLQAAISTLEHTRKFEREKDPNSFHKFTFHINALVAEKRLNTIIDQISNVNNSENKHIGKVVFEQLQIPLLIKATEKVIAKIYHQTYITENHDSIHQIKSTEKEETRLTSNHHLNLLIPYTPTIISLGEEIFQDFFAKIMSKFLDDILKKIIILETKHYLTSNEAKNLKKYNKIIEKLGLLLSEIITEIKDKFPVKKEENGKIFSSNAIVFDKRYNNKSFVNKFFNIIPSLSKYRNDATFRLDLIFIFSTLLFNEIRQHPCLKKFDNKNLFPFVDLKNLYADFGNIIITTLCDNTINNKNLTETTGLFLFERFDLKDKSDSRFLGLPGNFPLSVIILSNFPNIFPGRRDSYIKLNLKNNYQHILPNYRQVSRTDVIELLTEKPPLVNMLRSLNKQQYKLHFIISEMFNILLKVNPERSLQVKMNILNIFYDNKIVISSLKELEKNELIEYALDLSQKTYKNKTNTDLSALFWSLIKTINNKKFLIMSTINQIPLAAHFDYIYFNYYSDGRGRVYPEGFFLNLYGIKLFRAIFCFTKTKTLKETSVSFKETFSKLKLLIGPSKFTDKYEEKSFDFESYLLKEFKKIGALLIHPETSTSDESSLLSIFEEKLSYIGQTGILDIEKLLTRFGHIKDFSYFVTWAQDAIVVGKYLRGEITDFSFNFTTRNDYTSSGVQLVAILLGDPILLKASGLIETSRSEPYKDIYTRILEDMLEKITDIQNAMTHRDMKMSNSFDGNKFKSVKQVLFRRITEVITRSTIKKCVMPIAYAMTTQGKAMVFVKKIQTLFPTVDIINQRKVGQALQIVLDDSITNLGLSELYSFPAFFSSVINILKARGNEEVFILDTPNISALIKYKLTFNMQRRVFSFNNSENKPLNYTTKISIQYASKFTDFEKLKQSICASIVHSLDAMVLSKVIEILEKLGIPYFSIHDCVTSNFANFPFLKPILAYAYTEIWDYCLTFLYKILEDNKIDINDKNPSIDLMIVKDFLNKIKERKKDINFREMFTNPLFMSNI